MSAPVAPRLTTPSAPAAPTRVTARRARYSQQSTAVRARLFIQSRQQQPSVSGRAKFGAVLFLVMLAAVATQTVTSQQHPAAAYQLERAKEMNRALMERKQEIQLSIESAKSSSELALAATKLGMVTVLSAPIVVQGDNGELTVRGQQPVLGAPLASVYASHREPPAEPAAQASRSQPASAALVPYLPTSTD